MSITFGIDTFGESGAAGDVFAHFGFTPEKLADRVRRLRA